MVEPRDIKKIALQRAIYYPSSEIYEQVAGFYDYGTTGKKIKRNFEDYWRQYFLTELDENIHEIETTNIMPEAVFKASGHLDQFNDPMIKCGRCGSMEKAEEVLEDQLGKPYEGLETEELKEVIKEKEVKCPTCKGELGKTGVEVKEINLMFDVNIGPTSEEKAYLRPETAQGMFTAFNREYHANREKLPLGLAQIGKVYRNEISPRQDLFRLREFNQAEIQIFTDPDEINEHPDYEEIKNMELEVVPAGEEKKAEKKTIKELKEEGKPEKYLYYLAKMNEFFKSLGIEDMHLYEKSKEEKSFYNKIQFDFEAYFEAYDDYKEIAGMHYRTDYDLKQHMEHSGQNLEVNKEKEDGENKKFIPHVLEITFGIDRDILAILDSSYTHDEEGNRNYLALPGQVAPYKAAVFPLVTKDGLTEKAKEAYKEIYKEIDSYYDDSGSIGRRYRRADEIGIPYCITIDYDTLEDNTVTVRNRDTMEQDRVKIKELKKHLSSRF